MEGSLLVINENDLKLPPEKGLKFLKDTLNLNYSKEILNFINDSSEGWIGGLQLIAAAANGKKESEIMRLSFKNKLIGEYLTKEIYNFLDDEEKDFLIVTSILSYFNEEICLKLLGRMDFKKVMKDLLMKNTLIICIDEEKGIYRYHNILKEYLKERFNDLEYETQIQLHLKAADILKKIGDYTQCIDQLLLAEDYFRAMNLILEIPQNAALFSLADRIPMSFLVSNADFAYQSFFYYYVNVEFQKCRELYDKLQLKMCQNLTFSAFKFSNMFIEDTFKLIEADIMTIDEIEKLPLKEITKAYILIGNASFIYYSYQHRYKEALNFLDKAMSYSQSKYNAFITFFSFSIKSQILEDIGEFNMCIDLYNEMDKILLYNKNLFMLSTSFYIGITGVYLKQMDLKNAEKSLKNVEKYVSDLVLSIDRGYKFNLAEYKFITGETEEAMEIFMELIKKECYNNLVYIAPLLKYVFRLKKFSGKFKENFINDYNSIGEARKNFDSQLLYANILFSEGKIQDAMNLTDNILKHSRMHKLKLKLIQASLFKINMLFDSSDKKREIINLFRESLFYSHEDKILHPYYFESEIVTKVIKQYNSELQKDLSSTEKEHYREIIKLCKIQIKPILSERELEVLKEIAKGSSNKEIAEHLCISLATVKSHIINIYSKLQVNTRIAAVEAAKKYKL